MEGSKDRLGREKPAEEVQRIEGQTGVALTKMRHGEEYTKPRERRPTRHDRKEQRSPINNDSDRWPRGRYSPNNITGNDGYFGLDGFP